MILYPPCLSTLPGQWEGAEKSQENARKDEEILKTRIQQLGSLKTWLVCSPGPKAVKGSASQIRQKKPVQRRLKDLLRRSSRKECSENPSNIFKNNYACPWGFRGRSLACLLVSKTPPYGFIRFIQFVDCFLICPGIVFLCFPS